VLATRPRYGSGVPVSTIAISPEEVATIGTPTQGGADVKGFFQFDCSRRRA
jgi:hypothetical protein